jgi:hypothetical protein
MYIVIIIYDFFLFCPNENINDDNLINQINNFLRLKIIIQLLFK